MCSFEISYKQSVIMFIGSPHTITIGNVSYQCPGEFKVVLHSLNKHIKLKVSNYCFAILDASERTTLVFDVQCSDYYLQMQRSMKVYFIFFKSLYLILSACQILSRFKISFCRWFLIMMVRFMTVFCYYPVHFGYRDQAIIVPLFLC